MINKTSAGVALLSLATIYSAQAEEEDHVRICEEQYTQIQQSVDLGTAGSGVKITVIGKAEFVERCVADLEKASEENAEKDTDDQKESFIEYGTNHARDSLNNLTKPEGLLSAGTKAVKQISRRWAQRPSPVFGDPGRILEQGKKLFSSENQGKALGLNDPAAKSIDQGVLQAPKPSFELTAENIRKHNERIRQKRQEEWLQKREARRKALERKNRK